MEQNALQAERFLLNRALDKRIPINGSLELLPLCNMDCDMCYVRLSREEMEAINHIRRIFNGVKSEEAVDKVIDLFNKTKNNREFVEMVKKTKFF